jgi:hypothetical protein
MRTAVCVALALALASIAAAGEYPTPGSQGLRAGRGYAWLCDGGGAEPICAQPCPRRYGVALGGGPVYPVPFPGGVLRIAGGRVEHGWIYAKVLWIAAPSYRGPILIRGRQVDGTSWLGFEGGPAPLRDLQIPPLPKGEARRWRDVPTYTRFRNPGCHAYQVDGTSFTRVLVFAAG